MNDLPAGEKSIPCRWAHAIAETWRRANARAAWSSAQDPGLVCCVANKVAWITGVAVVNDPGGPRTLNLGANLWPWRCPVERFSRFGKFFGPCAEARPSCLPGRRGAYFTGAGRPCASLRSSAQ